MNEEKQPKEYDAVLGGNNPPPIDGLVLGGIEGLKRCLESNENEIKVKIAALQDALNYQDEGLDLIIKALNYPQEKISRFAYELLRERNDLKIRKAIQKYKFWDLLERLLINGYPNHATVFAGRTVEKFNPENGIKDPYNIAYAIRFTEDEWYENNQDNDYFRDKVQAFLQDPQIINLKALVQGVCLCEFQEYLIAAKQQLKNLEAILIGDLTSNECHISWMSHNDLSPILQAYPYLKLFQVRGRPKFSPLRHSHLESLIIETGGLNSNAIKQICELELPVLEHFELWLGSKDYGGHSSIDDLTSILSGEAYHNLVYLGLRNSEYSDDLASALQNAPVMNIIKVLDLSMGTLTDQGVDALLKCPKIEQLDFLNVSHNYLSNNAVIKLKQLKIRVIADKQKAGNYQDYRYCSVTE